jgi:hypothetical protein
MKPALPLVLEYEVALLRHAPVAGSSRRDVDVILEYQGASVFR